MEFCSKELLIGILIILLFYILIKKNNVMILTPNKDKMDNVQYTADDINDIDFSFKNDLKEDTEIKEQDMELKEDDDNILSN